MIYFSNQAYDIAKLLRSQREFSSSLQRSYPSALGQTQHGCVSFVETLLKNILTDSNLRELVEVRVRKNLFVADKSSILCTLGVAKPYVGSNKNGEAVTSSKELAERGGVLDNEGTLKALFQVCSLTMFSFWELYEGRVGVANFIESLIAFEIETSCRPVILGDATELVYKVTVVPDRSAVTGNLSTTATSLFGLQPPTFSDFLRFYKITGTTPELYSSLSLLPFSVHWCLFHLYSMQVRPSRIRKGASPSAKPRFLTLKDASTLPVINWFNWGCLTQNPGAMGRTLTSNFGAKRTLSGIISRVLEYCAPVIPSVGVVDIIGGPVVVNTAALSVAKQLQSSGEVATFGLVADLDSQFPDVPSIKYQEAISALERGAVRSLSTSPLYLELVFQKSL